LRHHDNVLSRFVIHVTVREHRVKILYALFTRGIEVIVQPFFNCSQVHRGQDDLVVVLSTKQKHFLLESHARGGLVAIYSQEGSVSWRRRAVETARRSDVSTRPSRRSSAGTAADL
jgi:hypothetical protein